MQRCRSKVVYALPRQNKDVALVQHADRMGIFYPTEG